MLAIHPFLLLILAGFGAFMGVLAWVSLICALPDKTAAAENRKPTEPPPTRKG